MQLEHVLIGGVFEHERDRDVLPEEGVLEAEAANVLHTLESLEHRIDIGGMDLRPPFVDLLSDAAAKVEHATVVEQPYVSGHKPPLADDFAGQVVPLEIALH